MMVGGFGSTRKPSEEEKGIVEKFKGDIAKKANIAEFKTFTVDEVSTQTVAGINYKFKVTTDEHVLEAIIWGKLDRTHELTKVEVLATLEQKKQLVGGFTGFRAAEKDEVSIAEKFKADVAKKIGAAEIKSYEVKSVKTQVVAGINYIFEVCHHNVFI
mmetsp:Transcript_14897/g.28349  ORF Transcript_14897/g.28349 Transcript_14897/m.28349 type:complete len:158 (-) Transcript_14897:499-972(-)